MGLFRKHIKRKKERKENTFHGKRVPLRSKKLGLRIQKTFFLRHNFQQKFLTDLEQAKPPQPCKSSNWQTLWRKIEQLADAES